MCVHDTGSFNKYYKFELSQTSQMGVLKCVYDHFRCVQMLYLRGAASDWYRSAGAPLAALFGHTCTVSVYRLCNTF